MNLIKLSAKQKADLAERKRRIKKKCRAIDAERLMKMRGDIHKGIFRG